MKKHIKDVGVFNVANYLKAVEIQKNTLFRIINGKGHYIVDGHPVPRKIFEQMHPIPHVAQKKNCDRTKIWMSDQQSY